MGHTNLASCTPRYTRASINGASARQRYAHASIYGAGARQSLGLSMEFRGATVHLLIKSSGILTDLAQDSQGADNVQDEERGHGIVG